MMPWLLIHENFRNKTAFSEVIQKQALFLSFRYLSSNAKILLNPLPEEVKTKHFLAIKEAFSVINTFFFCSTYKKYFIQKKQRGGLKTIFFKYMA